MAAPACFVFNRVFLDESFMKFRITPALFKEAETVLAQVLRFDRPADAVLSHYFRLHRQLGHADRGFVAETVFAFLRRRRSLEAVCSSQPDHRQRLLATLVLERGYGEADNVIGKVFAFGERFRYTPVCWIVEVLLLPDVTGRCSISPRRNSTLSSPVRSRYCTVFLRAFCSISGVISTPMTRPDSLTLTPA